MGIIVWLKDLGKENVSVAGGKGAQLGELRKAGFPVPDGFVVSTALYNDLAEKIVLPEKISGFLSKLDVENTDKLEDASSRIQSLIASAELPEKAEKEIIAAYKKIGGLVAVRSSATAEDLKDASFAGQQATFLNVAEDKLPESVKKCIASLFTARAIYYRAKKHFNYVNVSIAVVVQKMVDAKKAGVMFSLNPVTNDRSEIVIEAALGLGEAVVGGESIPDGYVVLKETCKVKDARISKESAVLNDSEISRLSQLAKKIEAYHGFPQDIEWAIDGKGKLSVLQARPVTTLQVRSKPNWKKILSREYAVQYTEVSLRSLSPECGFIVPSPFYRQVYVPEDKNEACYIDETEWNSFVSSLKEKYLLHPENYDEFERLFMETGSGYEKTAEQMAKTSIKSKSNGELKELYSDYQKKSLRYAPFIWIQFIINNFFSEKAKEIIAGKLGKDSKNLFGFIEIALKPKKKAASLQLADIAFKWEGSSEAERIGAYEKFKWIPCLDIHNKPWTKEEFFSHIAEFRKPSKEHAFTCDSMMKEITPSKEEKQVLDIAKRLAYLKDLKDDFRRRGVFYGQKLFEEIARRMGLKLDDISYLLEAEITGFLDTGKIPDKDVIGNRKKGFVISFNQEKRIVCETGDAVGPAMDKLGIVVFEEFTEEIKGVAASGGKARGKVTIVKGVSDLSKVKKGDIMIAVTTHPDYVPAMQKAAAIVTDEGGITSHAAIVSRELQLPCIVATKHATKSLKDGDEAEVDADAGVLRKIKK